MIWRSLWQAEEIFRTRNFRGIGEKWGPVKFLNLEDQEDFLVISPRLCENIISVWKFQNLVFHCNPSKFNPIESSRILLKQGSKNWTIKIIFQIISPVWKKVRSTDYFDVTKLVKHTTFGVFKYRNISLWILFEYHIFMPNHSRKFQLKTSIKNKIHF